MPDPISFTSTSPRFALPMLFVGQSQKEYTVNEAVARADMLLHCAIDGQAAAPPLSPKDGACWLIATGPTGEWAGHAGELACRVAGSWLFVAPRDGMRVLNRVNGQQMFYRGGWQAPATPAAPSGGTVIDTQARAAINAVVAALKASGILAPI